MTMNADAVQKHLDTLADTLAELVASGLSDLPRAVATVVLDRINSGQLTMKFQVDLVPSVYLWCSLCTQEGETAYKFSFESARRKRLVLADVDGVPS